MRGNVPNPPAPWWARANQKDPWQTRVNLHLKHRDVQAAKMGDETQPDQNGGGIGGMRFQVACSSDQMVPGVEQVPKGREIVHVKKLRKTSARSCRRKRRVEANAPGNAGVRGSFPARKGANYPRPNWK